MLPSLLLSSNTISVFLSRFKTDQNKWEGGKIPKMRCACGRGASLTDLLKTPHSSLPLHMARTPHVLTGCARCLCVRSFPFRKLIYYCSHSAPLHALLSIWVVVLAVCSNLLLSNCLTTTRPTATPARKEKKKMPGIS